MNLNKHESNNKLYLKLRHQEYIVGKEADKPLLVDVDPFRYGWDVHIDLRIEEKRRSDAPNLLRALELGYGSYHTNNVEVVRSMRSGATQVKGKKPSKKQIKSFRAAKKRWEEQRKMDRKMGVHLRSESFYSQSEMEYAGGGMYNVVPAKKSIPQKVFESLTEGVKKWFSLDDHDKDKPWWKPSYKCNIPIYWIRARAEVRWVDKIKVPNGDAISQENFVKAHKDEMAYRGYAGDKWYDLSKSYPRSKYRAQTRDKIKKFLKNEIEEDKLHVDTFIEYHY